MLRIRPNVRTTPTVRAKIPGSGEPSSILARRYERGTSTGQNIAWTTQHSDGPHHLPWKATREKRGGPVTIWRRLSSTGEEILPRLCLGDSWTKI